MFAVVLDEFKPVRQALQMSHELLDAIGLEIARRVCGRLRVSPGLLGLAWENLARWSGRNAGAPALLSCYDEWRLILDRPLNDILEILCAETETGQRLRQNSLFAGVLTPSEIWSIKSEVRRQHATNAA